MVIQESGGSDLAVADGSAVAGELAQELSTHSRVPVAAERVVVGIETARNGVAAAALARVVTDNGASLVLCDGDWLPDELAGSCRTAPVFADATAGDGSHLVLERAGSPAEQHTALVAAGAQLVVSFPGDGDGPAGFPLCPVVSVGGKSALHAALAGEFDAAEPLAAEKLWRLVLRVLSGAPCVAETLGLGTFALSRLARSM